MPRKREKIEREDDLVIVANLYKRNWTIRAIAAELTKRRPYSISPSQVKYDLDAIISRWKEKQKKYIDNFITIQLEQIAALKEEAWKEYIRSKSPTKSIKEKREAIVNTGIHSIKQAEDISDIELDAIFDDSIAIETKTAEQRSLENVEVKFTDLSQTTVEVDQVVQVTERLGNPKYLDLIQRLMDQECKLLGIYKTDDLGNNTSVVIIQTPPPESKEQYMPKPPQVSITQHEELD